MPAWLPPDPGIEIVAASRGYSKGLAQTEGIQVLVRPELAFGSVYIGFYVKNVTSPTSDGEAGLNIGYRTRAAGFDLGASASWKVSTAPRGDVDDEALELSGSAARRFGPATARIAVTWSPDDLGGTEETVFAEAGLSYGLQTSTSLSANIGRRERDGGHDYAAFNVGVTQTLLPGLSADVRWYDTDRSALGDAFEGRLVASLRARF